MSTPYEVGSRVGRYVLLAPIGRGGMGEVWRARHVRTEAEYALKFVHGGSESAEMQARRFEREVKAAARIGHVGVVEVIDCDADPSSGLPYLVMELLDGWTLDRWYAAADPPFSERARVLLNVLDPLAAAHQLCVDGAPAPIVHRDLKPGNIFVLRHPVMVPGTRELQRTKILDFGIARQQNVDGSGTIGGLGTPGYVSPEQARQASHVGPESDVFSVGVMLYEAVTGERPFPGNNMADFLAELLTSQPRPIRALAPQVDRRFAGLVQRCLAWDPTLRPCDAAALRDPLARILGRPEVLQSLDRGPATRSYRPRAPSIIESAALTPTTHPESDPKSSTRPATPMRVDVSASLTTTRPVVDIKGVALRSLLEVLDARYGGELRQALMESVPAETREVLEEPVLASKWYPVTVYRDVHVAAQRAMGSGPPMARELARAAVIRDFEGVYRHVVGVLRPHWLMGWAPRQINRYFRGVGVDMEEVRAGYARATLFSFHGFDESMWEDMIGSMEAILEVCGGRGIEGRILRGGGRSSFAQIEFQWR